MSSQAIPPRPLGLVMLLIERAGFRITHVYEDLVFIESNHFLLRMGHPGERLHLVFNEASEIEKRTATLSVLTGLAREFGLSVEQSGTYRLAPGQSEETISITFSE